MSAVPLADARFASRAQARTVNLADAPTLFLNEEVHAARPWKFGRSADFVFIESVWPLLDEFRARNRDKEAAP